MFCAWANLLQKARTESGKAVWKMEELVKYLKALTYLQLQNVTQGSAFSKPELLLERAGFTNREIGELLNKKEPAVAKTIQRAKAAALKGNINE
jgi:hypothetical protein